MRINSKMRVFLSMPTSQTEKQKRFTTGLKAKLREKSIESVTLGVSNFTNENPLMAVRSAMKECCGVIVLGYRQTKLLRGTLKFQTKKKKSVRDYYFATAWNQIEASFGAALDMPLLILSETGVTEGVFDPKNIAFQVHETNLSVAWLSKPNFTHPFQQWITNCGSRLSKNRANEKQLEWGQRVFTQEETINSVQHFKAKIRNASRVRICGWTLHSIVSEFHHELQALIRRGGELKIIVTSPESNGMGILKEAISPDNPLSTNVRKYRDGVDFAASDLQRTFDNLLASDLGKHTRLTSTLLPFSALIIEENGIGDEASIMFYPLHPNLPFAKRWITKNLDLGSPLWRPLIEQFDCLWESPLVKPLET